jgi:hypothetical protein
VKYFRISHDENKKTKILDDDAKLGCLPKHFQMQWFLYKSCCCARDWMICFNWSHFDKNKEVV